MEHDDPRLIAIEHAIADARELAENQRRIAGNALRGSWVSRLSMYVIGAVLFTTIFGVSLPPIVTGVLGIAVVAITIIGQQFRPDVKFITAKCHILQLARMLTTAQSELASLRAGDSDAPDPDTIMYNITSVTDEVERQHHLAYAVMRERIVSMMPRLTESQSR